MDFIFMLTRADQTVEDCLLVMDVIEPLGLKHIGFKDVGIDRATMRALNARIRAAGATSYMEVVSTDPQASLQSARAAREVGIDRLLGGTEVEATLAILAGSRIEYLPFPGRPHGHPTRLGGDADSVRAQCREYMARGCAGVDLLAYRATEADPIDLVAAAREGVGDGYLVVAGSVDHADKIRAIEHAGADAFTIGSAVFDGSYSPRKGDLRSQLRDVLAVCAVSCP